MRNVLSLFDGMGCCRIALDRLGLRHKYYSSEIELEPIVVLRHNYPDINMLGDVREVKGKNLPKIWLLTGGSPCQSFSMAGRRKGMVTTDDVRVTSLSQYLKLRREGFEFVGQSYLFWEYVRILKETKPKYFLLENVLMDKEWEKVITKTLGVNPIRINSNLVSAQNRDRLYWTNIPGVTVPEDKGIMLSSIVRGGKGLGVRGRKNKKNKYDRITTIRTDGKSNCLVTNPSSTNKVVLPNGNVRTLTVEECEVLQTVPKGYTNVPGISKASKYKMIGNGWTIDVISHIFRGLKK